MIDLYKDAPYKKQGKIPYGVQHSVFLTAEEKIRRKYREWSSAGASSSNSSSGSSAGGKATPSYQELVASMRTLLGSEDGKVDVMDLMKDETAIAEALAVAKAGKIEWVQHQSSLLGKKDDSQYMFRLVDHVPAGQAYGAKAV